MTPNPHTMTAFLFALFLFAAGIYVGLIVQRFRSHHRNTDNDFEGI